MPTKLAKHGTEAGYKAEIALGTPCERCRAAHRVFGRQYSKPAKAAGIKYGTHDVIDHLDKVKSNSIRNRSNPFTEPVRSPVNRPDFETSPTADQDQSEPKPTLQDRLEAIMGRVTTPNDGSEYVSSDESHEYIREIEHDASPAGGDEWEPVDDSEVIINEAGLKKIQENLGFYVVTVGMTFEIFDPYCGSVLAQNADSMIEHWSKVIGHYPGIAKHFLSKQGGVIFAWINALQATWPILMAIYNHHLARNIKVENGIIYRINKDGNRQAPPDATMPPMHEEYNYSVR